MHWGSTNQHQAMLSWSWCFYTTKERNRDSGFSGFCLGSFGWALVGRVKITSEETEKFKRDNWPRAFRSMSEITLYYFRICIYSTGVHFELWTHLLLSAVVSMVRSVYSHLKNLQNAPNLSSESTWSVWIAAIRIGDKNIFNTGNICILHIRCLKAFTLKVKAGPPTPTWKAKMAAVHVKISKTVKLAVCTSSVVYLWFAQWTIHRGLTRLYLSPCCHSVLSIALFWWWCMNSSTMLRSKTNPAFCCFSNFTTGTLETHHSDIWFLRQIKQKSLMSISDRYESYIQLYFFFSFLHGSKKFYNYFIVMWALIYDPKTRHLFVFVDFISKTKSILKLLNNIRAVAERIKPSYAHFNINLTKYTVKIHQIVLSLSD